jgi:hypothetical protein
MCPNASRSFFFAGDLVGGWTPAMQAEYLGFCDREQSLIERLEQERFVTV